MKLTNSIAVVLVFAILSCKSKTADSKQPTAAEKNPVVQSGESQAKEPSTPFLVASGDNASWTASVSSEKITIKTGDNIEALTFPYKTPLVATEAKLRVFRSTAGANTVEITVSDQACSTNVENEPYRYEIFITLTTGDQVQNLTGCGIFNSDKSLNTVWTLEQLNGITMTPDNFGQELPYIDIHTEIGSFTGFGGCNRMKGTVGLFEPGTILFSKVIATKMFCVAGNQESGFMKALQTATNYKIKNNKLHLYKGSDVVLIFKK